MTQFRVETFGADGRRASTLIEAPSGDAARRIAMATGGAAYAVKAVKRREKALPTASFLAILSEVAALTSANVALPEALSVAADQARSPEERRVLETLLADVRAGDAFSEALARVNTSGAATTAAAIATGEQTGDLGSALRRQIAEMERRQKLKAAMQSALIYPAILAVATLISILVILFAVVPGLAPIFESAGDAAPASARVLLAVSETLIENQNQIAISCAGFAALAALAIRRPATRAALSQRLLHAPVIGAMMSAAETARLLRTAASVLDGGAAAPRAMELAADGASLRLFRDMALSVAQAVREGETLSAALAREAAFEKNALGLITAGERSGDLAEMLNAAAGSLERRVEQSAQRIATIAPPLMTLILGGIVGGASITILSALMSVNDAAF